MFLKPSYLGSVLNKCKCDYSVFKNKFVQASVVHYSSLTPKSYYENASYFHQIGEKPLMYKTLGDCLQEAADKWPDRIWIKACFKNEQYTFSDALKIADRLAAGFIQLGLNRGDTIVICSPNSARWMLVSMAAARAGLILVLVNPLYQQAELNYSLNKVQAKCILMPSESRKQNYYQFMSNISPDLTKQDPFDLKLENLPHLKSIIMLDDQKMPGTLTYKELYSLSSNSAVDEISRLQKFISPDSGCNIQFTSGTTGNPKAAFLSHFSNVNNSFLLGKKGHFGDKHHTICCQVPLFHAFGFVVVTQGSLQYGSTVVLPSEWYNSEENFKFLMKERCSILGGTPTMHLDMISKVREKNVKSDYLDLVITGGASCPPQTFQDLKTVVGAKRAKSIYGLTETTAVNFMGQDNESWEDNTQTVGSVQEHIEIRVIDTDGNTVPFGTPGEVCVRGYCNMLGYWGDSEKTAEMIGPDKWLRTGDQLVLRNDGYGKIVGRFKDMIIRGGENVFPKEIEDFLHAHPDILECHVISTLFATTSKPPKACYETDEIQCIKVFHLDGVAPKDYFPWLGNSKYNWIAEPLAKGYTRIIYVFGIKDDRLGEEICAGLMLREGSQLNIKELTMFSEGKIASFKIPRHIKILNSFPKTGSGKIQKYKLRQMVEKGVI